MRDYTHLDPFANEMKILFLVSGSMGFFYAFVCCVFCNVLLFFHVLFIIMFILLFDIGEESSKIVVAAIDAVHML